MSQKDFLSSMLEQSALKAAENDTAVYEDFYEPVLQMLIEKEIGRYPSADALFFGGHEYAQRKMLSFVPSGMSLENASYPIDCLQIKLPGHCELTHRDVLGALTSLGIAREKIGDINFLQETLQFFLASPLGDFVINELSKIGKYNLSAVKVPFESVIAAEPEFTSVDIIVASMRADVIVHTVFKLSRSEASAFVKGEKVYVNHALITKPSFMLKQGDVVSVRSKGRFIVDGQKGTTKKNNIRLGIRKFA